MTNDEGRTAYTVAPPLVFAVWIRGHGWLKEKDDDAQTTFVAFSPEVAESAARLWGRDAQVLPFDQSLLDLEKKFLRREQELSAPRSVTVWMKRHGILG